MNKIKILITGWSGKLGRRLCRYLSKTYDISAPGRKELDITDWALCKKWVTQSDVLIHLAAYTDVQKAETDKTEAYTVNVGGTLNMVKAWLNNKRGKNIVYLSTDYVFDGEKGNYDEDDVLHPVNFYGLTKAFGEWIVKSVENHLIIRTSFKAGLDKYKKGYTDMYTSADDIDLVASEVANAIVLYLHGKVLPGVLHIGTERKSMFDLIQRFNPKLQKDTIGNHKGVKLPRDCSLNTDKWNFIKMVNGLTD